MPVTSITPTGPAGTCDICGKPFGHYEGNVECGVCEAVHCDACYSAALKRGDVDEDADYRDGSWVNLTKWKGCLNCSGKTACPHCDKYAKFTHHELPATSSSPREEWLTCSVCGAQTDADELRASNSELAWMKACEENSHEHA